MQLWKQGELKSQVILYYFISKNLIKINEASENKAADCLFNPNE